MQTNSENVIKDNMCCAPLSNLGKQTLHWLVLRGHCFHTYKHCKHEFEKREEFKQNYNSCFFITITDIESTFLQSKCSLIHEISV